MSLLVLARFALQAFLCLAVVLTSVKLLASIEVQLHQSITHNAC